MRYEKNGRRHILNLEDELKPIQRLFDEYGMDEFLQEWSRRDRRPIWEDVNTGWNGYIKAMEATKSFPSYVAVVLFDVVTRRTYHFRVGGMQKFESEVLGENGIFLLPPCHLLQKIIRFLHGIALRAFRNKQNKSHSA